MDAQIAESLLPWTDEVILGLFLLQNLGDANFTLVKNCIKLLCRIIQVFKIEGNCTDYMSLVASKTVLLHVQPTKAKISLCICAV